MSIEWLEIAEEITIEAPEVLEAIEEANDDQSVYFA